MHGAESSLTALCLSAISIICLFSYTATVQRRIRFKPASPHALNAISFMFFNTKFPFRIGVFGILLHWLPQAKTLPGVSSTISMRCSEFWWTTLRPQLYQHFTSGCAFSSVATLLSASPGFALLLSVLSMHGAESSSQELHFLTGLPHTTVHQLSPCFTPCSQYTSLSFQYHISFTDWLFRTLVHYYSASDAPPGWRLLTLLRFAV